MTVIESIAKIIGIGVGAIGALIVLTCVIEACLLATTKRIKGNIVDCVQEYTSRGFLWKTKVEYINNEKPCFYVMRARTAKRSSGEVTLHVTKRGRVIEVGHMIEKFIIGIAAIAIAIVLTNIIR